MLGASVEPGADRRRRPRRCSSRSSSAWFLLGTAARAKQDREREARMRAVIQPGGAAAAAQADRAAGRVDPGERHEVRARGSPSRGGSASGSTRELEAAGVSLRSGEFVVASAVAALVVRRAGRGPPRSWLLALVVAAIGGALPTSLLRSALKQARGQAPRAAARTSSRSWRRRCAPVTASCSRSTRSRRRSPSRRRREFQRVVAEIRLGRPAEDALEALAERVGSAGLQVGRARGEHPARGRRQPRRDPRQRRGHPARARDAPPADQGADGGGPALRVGPRRCLPFAIALYMSAVNPEYIGLLFDDDVRDHHARSWRSSCWCSGSSG